MKKHGKPKKMKEINYLGKEKVFANLGVDRNKKPLSNIVYEVKIYKELKVDNHAQYKFKNIGYLVLNWYWQKSPDIKYFHGLISEENLRKRISAKQWSKFCNDVSKSENPFEQKYQIIIQRREDGKNKPSKQKSKE